MGFINQLVTGGLHPVSFMVDKTVYPLVNSHSYGKRS